jgi:hypothetical protein
VDDRHAARIIAFSAWRFEVHPALKPRFVAHNKCCLRFFMGFTSLVITCLMARTRFTSSVAGDTVLEYTR